MVRCQECGFTNEPGALVCKKCGSRLEGAASGSASSTPEAPKPNAGNPTMIGGAASGPAWDSGQQTPSAPKVSNPTMRGAQSNMPAWDDNNPSPAYTPAPTSGPTAASGATASTAKCPACGFYPLRNEVSASHPCPNCGSTGSGSAVAKENPAQQQGHEPASASHQMQKASNANKTIRLGDLTPEEDKKPEFQLVDERSQSAKEFSGEEVSVNRDALDAGNMSISGQEHARFVYEDGKWYLSDHSSNGATFVQVQGKIEVSEGTKILIGNRIYTFQSK